MITATPSSRLLGSLILALAVSPPAPQTPPATSPASGHSHRPSLTGPAAPVTSDMEPPSKIFPATRCPHPPRGQPPAKRLERESILMGTRLRATVDDPDRQTAIQASEAVFDEVARLETVLSSWTSDSELGRLNSAPTGRTVPLSDELGAVLMEVRAWTARSGGAFDPVIGSFIDAWDLRGEGRRPSPEELVAARAAAGWQALRVEGTTRWARRNARTWVTSGGFGKGMALRAAARELGDSGVEAALLDFGGQLTGIAADSCASWVVAVAHPARRDEPVALLRLPLGHSLATSGSSERFVEVNGERYGHVIDPRSGRPVEAWGSVTVLAEDAVVADVAATAAYVLGPCEGLSWASREGLSALALRVRGAGGLEALWSESLAPWIVELDPRVSVSPASGEKSCASLIQPSPEGDHDRGRPIFWKGGER